MGIEVVSASIQNILPYKYIAPMGIEIVSVVVQIVPAVKNLPRRLQILVFLQVVKSGDKSKQIYIS